MEDAILEIGSKNEMIDEIVREYLDRRILIFNEDINDSLLEKYMLQIIKWNKQDKDIPVDKRKIITIILNSCGGDTLSGMMFLGLIKQSITPIKCIVMGMAASMASYIPCVCSESFGFEYSVICIHDGITMIGNTSRKANDVMDFYQKCDDKMAQILFDNTKIDAEFLDKIADREYYIFADKAKELGIIDKIIGVDCTLDEVL